jgi:UDP-2,3-diacylglucosamine pyrophosphatase LpxH
VAYRLFLSSPKINQDSRRQQAQTFFRDGKIYHQFAHQKFLEGCDVMVMGHSHDEDFATFTVQDRVGAYFNIGYPRVHGHYIYWVLPEKLPERRLFC